MGKYYRHLTSQDRIQLYEYLFTGEPITEIANHLGFHKTTIYRELERNSSHHGYRPDWASQQYLARKFHHGFKLDKNSELKEFIITRLKEGWSPQQIAGRPHLITLRERKSRYLVAIKNDSRKPHKTANTLIKYMKNNFNNTIHSLTLDNDTAFAYHPMIANAFAAPIYFCEPYKSYQKGAVENANRLLRRYLPKKSSIEKHTQQNIEMIVRKLNNQPTRCLNYRTPIEAF